MQLYKIPEAEAQAILDSINSQWLQWYNANQRNPKDHITVAYCDMTVIDGYAYIMKDSVTEQYVTGDFEVVDSLPTNNDTEDVN
jgi:hypothetical protein